MESVKEPAQACIVKASVLETKKTKEDPWRSSEGLHWLLIHLFVCVEKLASNHKGENHLNIWRAHIGSQDSGLLTAVRYHEWTREKSCAAHWSLLTLARLKANDTKMQNVRIKVFMPVAAWIEKKVLTGHSKGGKIEGGKSSPQPSWLVEEFMEQRFGVIDLDRIKKGSNFATAKILKYCFPANHFYQKNASGVLWSFCVWVCALPYVHFQT